jgi:hypothetical protein
VSCGSLSRVLCLWTSVVYSCVVDGRSWFGRCAGVGVLCFLEMTWVGPGGPWVLGSGLRRAGESWCRVVLSPVSCVCRPRLFILVWLVEGRGLVVVRESGSCVSWK